MVEGDISIAKIRGHFNSLRHLFFMALTSGSYNDIFNAVPFRFSLSSCERRGYSKSKMRFIHFLCVFFLSFSLVLPPSAQAYWIWSPAEGKFVKPESTSTEPQ